MVFRFKRRCKPMYEYTVNDGPERRPLNRDQLLGFIDGMLNKGFPEGWVFSRMELPRGIDPADLYFYLAMSKGSTTIAVSKEYDRTIYFYIIDKENNEYYTFATNYPKEEKERSAEHRKMLEFYEFFVEEEKKIHEESKRDDYNEGLELAKRL